MRLFSLISNLHSELPVAAAKEPFIIDIEIACGENFEHCEDDFSDYGSRADDIIYVRTGGTEGLFKQIWRLKIRQVTLLASGQSNSLAASMEIISFLRKNGASGRIIHGKPEEIAAALKQESARNTSSLVKPFNSGNILFGARLGVVGRPSDWLISSDVDYAKAPPPPVKATCRQ